jgi:predicted DNA-binding transcriptional regulator AlpA
VQKVSSHTATHHSPETCKTVSTQSTFDNLPDSGYLRQAQLIPAVVPFSSATLWRKCKAGHFPKPVKLSERVTAWNVGQVREFLKTQAGGVPA